MGKARYFKNPEDVIFFHPIQRFFVWLFGAERMVKRCKVCGKIPTELYGGYCLDHIQKDESIRK